MTHITAPRDRGAAAVEFAIVVIPLLFIVFAIVNFGFIFASQISVNSAARDAARAGVVKPLAGAGEPMSCADIATQARIDAVSIGSMITRIGVDVSGPAGACGVTTTGAVTGAGAISPCTSSSGGGALTVLVRHDYVSPVPLVPPSSSTLTSTGSFRCEYR